MLVQFPGKYFIYDWQYMIYETDWLWQTPFRQIQNTLWRETDASFLNRAYLGKLIMNDPKHVLQRFQHLFSFLL